MLMAAGSAPPFRNLNEVPALLGEQKPLSVLPGVHAEDGKGPQARLSVIDAPGVGKEVPFNIRATVELKAKACEQSMPQHPNALPENSGQLPRSSFLVWLAGQVRLIAWSAAARTPT